jgi:hypothetical protein
VKELQPSPALFGLGSDCVQNGGKVADDTRKKRQGKFHMAIDESTVDQVVH